MRRFFCPRIASHFHTVLVPLRRVPTACVRTIMSTSTSTPSVSNLYSPLPSATSIRLIKLKGYISQDQSKEKLVNISLEPADVKASPPFDALSYTWGDPLCRDLDPSLLPKDEDAIKQVICCNGVVVTVQPNLLAALQMLLASAAAMQKSEYIWIDALCINQTDPDEIAAQVSIMGSIYLRAEKVIAWLGPEDATIPDALSVLDRLALLGKDTTGQDFSQESLAHIDERIFLHPEEHKEKLGIEPIDFRQWLCFVAFLSRPYFNRVWIVQEVTLARKITAVCGTRIMDWQKLFPATLFLFYTGWAQFLNLEPLARRATELGVGEGFENFLTSSSTSAFSMTGLVRTKRDFRSVDWNELRRDKHVPENWTLPYACSLNLAMESMSLLELIENHRTCLATNPRDMVYGLLGISGVKRSPFADMTVVLEDNIPRLIKVDYKISVEEAYTRAARSIMGRSSRGLEILEHREDNEFRVLKTLPSWVPDFSTGQLPARLGMNAPFSAGGRTQWEDTSTEENAETNPGLLPVKGVCLGNILNLTPRRPDMKEYYQFAAEVAGTLSPFYGIQPQMDTEGPKETRAEVLARTCLANTFDRSTEIPPQDAELVFEFMHHIAEIVSTVSITAKYPQEDGTILEYTFFVRLSVDRQDFQIPFQSPDTHTDATSPMSPPPSLPNLDGLVEPLSTPQFAINAVGRPDIPNFPAKELLEEHLTGSAVVQLMFNEPEGSPFSLSSLFDAFGALKGIAPGDKDYFRRGPGAKYRAAADWYTLGSRRVFSTNSELLGLGPLSSEAGDEVWVLEGGKTPFVLRRKSLETEQELGQAGSDVSDTKGKGKEEEGKDLGSRYEFIGPAYVHGVMHGEAFDLGRESVGIYLE